MLITIFWLGVCATWGPSPSFWSLLSPFLSRFLSISLTLFSFTLKTQPPLIVVQASSNTKTQSKPFSRPYKCEPTVRLVKFGAQTWVLHYCFELRLFRRFSRRSSQGYTSNSCRVDIFSCQDHWIWWRMNKL